MLSSPHSPSFERAIELATVGRTLDIIIGDGNCFFRALSKELFGDQQFHHNLRQIIVNFIYQNSLLFEPLLRAPDHESDIVTIETHCTQMLQEGEFATEMEIQAAASFLQIPVYLYTKCPPHTTWIWYRYTPAALPDTAYLHIKSGRNFPLPAPENYHIEMCHTGLIHFDRIIPINPDNWENYLADFPALSGRDDPKLHLVE